MTITQQEHEADHLEGLPPIKVGPEPAAETAPEPEEPSVTGMTVDELTDTLTGFEEIAIAKAFSKELSDLPGTQPLRALVMIWHKRTDELADADAYQKAMEVTLGAVMGYFEGNDEITPETPETESGKG